MYKLGEDWNGLQLLVFENSLAEEFFNVSKCHFLSSIANKDA